MDAAGGEGVWDVRCCYVRAVANEPLCFRCFTCLWSCSQTPIRYLCARVVCVWWRRVPRSKWLPFVVDTTEQWCQAGPEENRKHPKTFVPKDKDSCCTVRHPVVVHPGSPGVLFSCVVWCVGRHVVTGHTERHENNRVEDVRHSQHRRQEAERGKADVPHNGAGIRVTQSVGVQLCEGVV